ncbi:thiol-disulfide oxidoreductase DCC family protein [Enemella sp. A6]|uniref:thiol-disulfide oxidoreductase DCC family protein n=1 Tax=Enemella sp. A6 TaxID=3440152 RepID=UPI003EBC722D
MVAPGRPVLVYDGDCRFCTRAARRAEGLRRDPSDFVVVPYQRADLAALGLTRQECARALQWVDAVGGLHSGAEAVAGLLRAGPWWSRPVGRLLRLPGCRALARIGYRLIADNRHRLPG